jgi:molybdopterin synthase catalytic subunit
LTVRVQQAAFDPGAELTAFSTGRAEMGAIVTFSGIVRDVAGDLRHLVIEHYPAMTQPAIEAMKAKAVRRWSLGDCLIIHRFGKMRPGEVIMMVATASAHRADAFEAAQFLMDYLKSRAPFWKKEVTDAGEAWVAAKDEDETALKRW